MSTSNELRWDRWEGGAKGDQRWLFDDRCYIHLRWSCLVWCRSVVFDGSIYVVGGSNDGDSTSVECFTPGPPGSKPVRHQVRYAFFSKKELNTGNRFERWKTFPWAATLGTPCVWRSSTIGSQWWVEAPRRCSLTAASSVTGTNQVQTWLLRINLCFQLEPWSDRPRWMARRIWKTFSWS